MHEVLFAVSAHVFVKPPLFAREPILGSVFPKLLPDVNVGVPSLLILRPPSVMVPYAFPSLSLYARMLFLMLNVPPLLAMLPPFAAPALPAVPKGPDPAAPAAPP